MILRTRWRQGRALTSSFFRFNRPQPPHARLLHTLPSLGAHDSTFKENGIPDLYSPDAFRTAWTDYQSYTIEQLNQWVTGTVQENVAPKDLAIATARDPTAAPVFNYASMAYNNHFYFASLSPETTTVPRELAGHLTRSFSSLDTLRDTMIETARAMFGPGFVWLVQLSEVPMNVSAAADPGSTQHFRLLTTYLAGSPLPGAHHRQQPIDANTLNLRDEQNRLTSVQNDAGSFGEYSSTVRNQEAAYSGFTSTRRLGGAMLSPVLCVNTWQHAWMFDYGIRGKKDFLERWWDRIDWNVVEGRRMKTGSSLRWNT